MDSIVGMNNANQRFSCSPCSSWQIMSLFATPLASQSLFLIKKHWGPSITSKDCDALVSLIEAVSCSGFIKHPFAGSWTSWLPSTSTSSLPAKTWTMSVTAISDSQWVSQSVFRPCSEFSLVMVASMLDRPLSPVEDILVRVIVEALPRFAICAVGGWGRPAGGAAGISEQGLEFSWWS